MMTQQQELDKELYALLKEQGADPRTYAGVTARLQVGLEAPVPMRPEFKANLRARLMAEAKAGGRRPVRWFQRPAVLSAIGSAAAIVVLAIGLRVFTDGGKVIPPLSGVTPPGSSQPNQGPSGTPHLVSKTDLPEPHLPDEHVAGQPTSDGSLEKAEELPTYTLTGKVTVDLTKGIAEALDFHNPAVGLSDRFEVTEGARTLAVSKTGELVYEDASGGTGQGVKSKSEAVQVANQFLAQALLPVVDANPAVAEASQDFLVRYQDRFQGRPIVNGDTQVWVSRSGGVKRVQSVTPSGQEQSSSYSIVAYADAVKTAETSGGRFDRGDLVWVRTPLGEQVILQPYWRLFGQDSTGPIIRYVSALQR